jgi:hypothetical protein
MQQLFRATAVTLITWGFSSASFATAATFEFEAPFQQTLENISLQGQPPSAPIVSAVMTVPDPPEQDEQGNPLPPFELPEGQALTGVTLDLNANLLTDISLQANSIFSWSVFQTLTLSINQVGGQPGEQPDLLPFPLLPPLFPSGNETVIANQTQSVAISLPFDPTDSPLADAFETGEFPRLQLTVANQTTFSGVTRLEQSNRRLSGTVTLTYQTKTIDPPDPGDQGDSLELPEPSLLLAIPGLILGGLFTKRREPVSKVR